MKLTFKEIRLIHDEALKKQIVLKNDIENYKRYNEEELSSRYERLDDDDKEKNVELEDYIDFNWENGYWYEELSKAEKEYNEWNELANKIEKENY